MIGSLLFQVMPIYTTRPFATISTAAYGINASGQIVGVHSQGPSYGGFLYSGGTYTPLIIPGTFETNARGINAAGHIVGYYVEKTANGVKAHGFLYTNGLYAIFDCPLATYWTTAFGIN